MTKIFSLTLGRGGMKGGAKVTIEPHRHEGRTSATNSVKILRYVLGEVHFIINLTGSIFLVLFDYIFILLQGFF